MSRFLFPVLFAVFSFQANSSAAQYCNPPIDPILNINTYFDTSYLFWTYESTECEILYFEIEYSYTSFTPGQGEGILISGVTFSPQFLGASFYQFAWIRSVCDCEPLGGDGFPDNSSEWIPAGINFIPPPIFPDEGIDCTYAPEEPVDFDYICGYSGYMLIYHGMYAPVGMMELPCSNGEQYVLWRNFTAPFGGAVNISIDNQNFMTIDFGYTVFQGSCNGSLVECVGSISSGEENLLTGLIEGEEYFVACWNNNVAFYDGFTVENNLNICLPALDCYYPSNFNISQITDHTAYLSWNANTSNLWTIEYGPEGFALGDGILIENVNTNYYLLSDLESGTEYDFYVTANCGEYTSTTIGPGNFTTNPSMWITGSISGGHKFCCDDLSQLPTEIGVFAYCTPVSYSFTDESSNDGCDYTFTRTITAVDECGNSIDYSFSYEIYDNQIPGGCSEEFIIPSNSNGKAVAISGDWAALENGTTDLIYQFVDDEWTLHSSVALGNNAHNTLAMFGDVIISTNNVYRLTDGTWQLETSLVSSLGDQGATASSIHGNTIALEMNNRIFIFEYFDSTWNEVAMFDQNCASLDLGENVLLTGGSFGEYIGRVYRKQNDIWALEQELMPFDGGTGNEIGYDVAIDGDRAAIGHRWSGGIYTYLFNGAEWQNGEFMTNPFLYSQVGYYSTFGSAIDIEGDLLIAGDYMNRANGAFSGSLVVYEWTCGAWLPQRNIVPINGAVSQRFGGCVDLSGSRVVVGIETTYWLGGYSYNGAGKFWFYTNLEPLNEFSITVEPGTTIECGEELPAPSYTVGLAWCDEYEVTIEETGSTTCGDTLTRTYTISDGLGNTSYAIQEFTFTDSYAPELVSINPDFTWSCSEIYVVESPVFSDNCSVSLDITPSYETTGDDCTTIVIHGWTATDDCGNSTTVSQVVTVMDTDAPQFSCPDDIMVEIMTSEEFYIVSDFISPLELSDNCDTSPTASQSIAAGSQLTEGIHEVEITASDQCGNITICSFNVVVEVADGISETGKNHLMLFPNPANEILNIYIDEHGEKTINIYDTEGKLICVEKTQGSYLQLDISQYANGLYQMQIQLADKTLLQKFMIE